MLNGSTTKAVCLLKQVEKLREKIKILHWISLKVGNIKRMFDIFIPHLHYKKGDL